MYFFLDKGISNELPLGRESGDDTQMTDDSSDSSLWEAAIDIIISDPIFSTDWYALHGLHDLPPDTYDCRNLTPSRCADLEILIESHYEWLQYPTPHRVLADGCHHLHRLSPTTQVKPIPIDCLRWWT